MDCHTISPKVRVWCLKLLVAVESCYQQQGLLTSKIRTPLTSLVLAMWHSPPLQIRNRCNLIAFRPKMQIVTNSFRLSATNAWNSVSAHASPHCVSNSAIKFCLASLLTNSASMYVHLQRYFPTMKRFRCQTIKYRKSWLIYIPINCIIAKLWKPCIWEIL